MLLALLLGAHILVRNDRYVAGFAWLDGGVVSIEPALSAPSESSRGLSELYQRGLELCRRKPAGLALLKNEAIRAPATFRVAVRAEGVLVAAAQHVEIAVSEWAGAGLYKPAGIAKAKGVGVQIAVDALVKFVGIDPSERAQRLAVAAVVAQGKKLGLI